MARTIRLYARDRAAGGVGVTSPTLVHGQRWFKGNTHAPGGYNDQFRPAMHERFMREALRLAALAREAGEVPVGAVVVVNGEILGRGFNRPIGSCDPTAHAEVVALREAAAAAGNYRLTGAQLYVTIEPCLMCVGAMIHARLGTLIFGTPEPKAGAIESTQRAHEHPSLNHRLVVVSGVLAAECREIVRRFFQERRRDN